MAPRGPPLRAALASPAVPDDGELGAGGERGVDAAARLLAREDAGFSFVDSEGIEVLRAPPCAPEAARRLLAAEARPAGLALVPDAASGAACRKAAAELAVEITSTSAVRDRPLAAVASLVYAFGPADAGEAVASVLCEAAAAIEAPGDADGKACCHTFKPGSEHIWPVRMRLTPLDMVFP